MLTSSRSFSSSRRTLGQQIQQQQQQQQLPRLPQMALFLTCKLLLQQTRVVLLVRLWCTVISQRVRRS
jgi:hypothetical protein